MPSFTPARTQSPRTRLEMCYSSMLYGCESWQATSAERDRINAVQTKALRRCLHLRASRVSSEEQAARLLDDDDVPDVDAVAIIESAQVTYETISNAALRARLGRHRQTRHAMYDEVSARQLKFALDVAMRPRALPEARAAGVMTKSWPANAKDPVRPPRVGTRQRSTPAAH